MTRVRTDSIVERQPAPLLREVFGKPTNRGWYWIAANHRNQHRVGQRKCTGHDVAEESNLGKSEIVVRHRHHAFVLEYVLNHG